MDKICKELNPKTGRCIKKKIMTNINEKIIDNLKIMKEYTKVNKEPFKSNAYSKAIDGIELYEKPIEIDDIKNIKGVGAQIQSKIIEYITTGKMSAVENALKDDNYILGKKLMNIYGIGPSKIEELLTKIKTFDDLYLDENISLLNEKQKIGLKYYKDLETRIPYAEGKKHYKIIQKTFSETCKDIEFEMVGSYRRKNKDMGDIDILIKNNNTDLKEIISNLQSKGYIIETLASGKNKFMGICRLSQDVPARRIDILVADVSYYYFALLYFTGSYNFNIYMRKIALGKGLSLSEYGLKDNKTKEMLDTKDSIMSEEDIFKYLDIPYVVPNKR